MIVRGAMLLIAALAIVMIASGMREHAAPVPPSHLSALSPCEKDHLAHRSTIFIKAITASDVAEVQAKCVGESGDDVRDRLVAEQARAVRVTAK